MSKKSKARRQRYDERRKAAAELDQIRDNLCAAYSCFNNTSDPELTDAYIYEINALRARYDHALRKAKRMLTETGGV